MGVAPTVACQNAGVGKSFINSIEARGSIPSVDRVEKLAGYLGCTVSELIGEQPPPGREAPEPVTVPEDPLIREIMERVHDLTPDQKRLYLAQLRALQDPDK
jgi:transcriptional regulator with XRE-family HTH domain